MQPQLGGAAPRLGEGSVLLPDGWGIPGEMPPQHGWKLLTPSPRRGWDSSPTIPFHHHRGEHRSKHQSPSRVPVPGVSSVVRLGVCVAKQPISHRWVSMVMEQEGGGVEAEQMLLFTGLHPCPKALHRPVGTGMHRVQELSPLWVRGGGRDAPVGAHG